MASGYFYHIVQKFDGGKFWQIWRMDVELLKFSYQNFALRKFLVLHILQIKFTNLRYVGTWNFEALSPYFW